MKKHADFAVAGFLATLLLCLAAIAPSALGQTTPTFYSFTNLAALGMTVAYNLNNRGEAVGDNSQRHGLLYSGGTMTDLGTLGGDWSDARAINDSGQVVGTSETRSGYPYPHAFLYSGGAMTDLGHLPDGSTSEAYGINSGGQIVGVSSWSYGSVSFLYSGGTMSNFWPYTYGHYPGSVRGINNSGQIVLNVPVSFTACYLYSDGVPTAVGTIGGWPRSSEGRAINDSGQIVGWSETTNYETHAFLYSGGQINDLGTLGGTYSLANDINNSGQIVGSSTTSNDLFGEEHAFLYSGGTMTDISLTPDLAVTRLEWDATTAGLKFSYVVSMVSSPTSSAWRPVAINDHGQILCDNGTLLTPITPPPTSAKLFWADSAGTKISDAPIFVRMISSGSIGDSGLIAVPVSSLQNRPTNATEVLLVLDPDNQLPEINKANNVAALNYTCFGPVITVQPLNRTNIEGATVTFSVGAASAEPLSYQWRYQGTSLQNNGRISGVNSAQLTIADIQTNDIGNYDVIVSNDCGTTNSSSVSLTITAKPVITDQPQSQTNAVGADVTFVVGVVGLPPLTYQWRHEGANLLNGGNISGADSSALHLANLETNDAGSYDVIVTNDYGSDTSVAATLTVTSVPPAIVQQPTNRLYVAGGNATFTAMFSGTEPLWYQWRKDGMNLADNARITGASGTVTTRAATHTSVLAITDLQPDDIGDYSVVITNVSGSITSTVAGFFPVITAGPTIYTNITVGTEAGFFTNVFNGGGLVAGSAVTVVEGDSAAIAYGFLASMPMAVTWRQAVTDNVFADLSTASYDIAPIGVVGSTDVITNVQPWNAGLYEIVVTNNYGAITSLMASVIVKTKPHITLQPSDQTVAQGGTNVFPVVFNGTEPLSLQWRKDGTNLTDNARISGTTATISAIANSHTNLLIIENLQTNDAGNYTVVITNNYGSITSVVANLTIGLAPVITNQPVNVTNGVGATVTFMAYAMGTELLSYQWRKNGTNLLNGGRVSGATSSVLALANIQLTDAGGYDLIVTNDFGHTNSSIATLDVQATFGGGGNNGTNGNSNTSLEGLLLWLPFDGGAADASGNGRDGVVQGAMLTTNRFGFTNSAYAFNGGNYIQVDNLDPDVYTNGFSFGAWVRPDASSGVLGWTYDAGWGATYIVAGGSTVAFRVGTGNPATDHSVSASVPVGAWSHLFITHSPTNDTLYLDGAMVGQWPSYPMQGNVSTLLIGSSYAGNFNGAIDDVAVYGRALLASEVAALFNGAPITSGPPPQLESPMVSEGSFSFNLVADPGTQFTILVSTNLADWDPVSTITVPAGGSTNVVESVTPGIKQAFYRVQKQ